MARPPFPKHSEYLQLLFEDTYAGAHAKNVRETFTSFNSATRANTFSGFSGTQRNGEWYSDAGDLTNAKEIREPRAYCIIGKYTQTFSGTNIIVRIETDSGRGTMKVKIDGVAPSTIAGLTAYVDTINFDADASLLGKGYFDITVADGLSDTAHTLELFAENSNQQYIAVVGTKVSHFNSTVSDLTAWKSTVDTQLNNQRIILKNTGATAVEDVLVTYPANFETWDGVPLSSEGPFSIQAGATYNLDFAFDGTSLSSTHFESIQLECNYKDDEGLIDKGVSNTLDVNNVGLTYSANGWSKDQLAPGGVWRAFTTGIGKTVSFTTTATSFTITVQKEYGWGVANVLVDGVQFTTVTSADPVGGGFLQDVVVSGMAAGSKTVTLSSVNGATKPFCFTKIVHSTVSKFSSVVEYINLNYNVKHVPPFAPTNARLEGGVIKWDNPILTSDLTNKNAPRDNNGIVEHRVYSRFPTYCVFYGPGMSNIMNQYDLIVIEPRSMSRKEIQSYQAKGIKVYGYVSFGEEDGEKLDVFDLGSPDIGPHRDDMLGTDGYASYYNKGGNMSGESSECNHDRQRVEGVKACALLNPKYNTGAGRCSKACNKDWKLGYTTHQAGGACGGGYTKNNRWQRDAMTACSNAACPGYTPINQKCTQFQEAEVKWSQDFQTMDTFPDQNGIWNSTFVNPIAPRWKQKLNTYYLPYTLGTQQEYTEVLTLSSHTATVDGARKVVRCTHHPIDDGEVFTVKSSDGLHEYVANLDFSYDTNTGVISFDPGAAADTSYPLSSATQVSVNYVRKGLQCDGVFMDTVDTVDVYPSPAFQQAFIDMVNWLKSQWPTKMFCSNRGFSILEGIIGSCHHVMFETFISDYNFATGEYGLIDDPGAIEWNNSIKVQLRNLRKRHKFDVLALNYAPNDSSGDTIRQVVTEQCYAEGYMSWTSVISLQEPLAPVPVSLGTGKLRSNAYKLQFRKRHK